LGPASQKKSQLRTTDAETNGPTVGEAEEMTSVMIEDVTVTTQIIVGALDAVVDKMRITALTTLTREMRRGDKRRLRNR
jgi:hypothetical protein